MGHSADVYDTSKKRRIPAWTDRILHSTGGGGGGGKGGGGSGANTELLSYTSAAELRISDHRPVAATFRFSAIMVDATTAAVADGSGSSPRLVKGDDVDEFDENRGDDGDDRGSGEQASRLSWRRGESMTEVCAVS